MEVPIYWHFVPKSSGICVSFMSIINTIFETIKNMALVRKQSRCENIDVDRRT